MNRVPRFLYLVVVRLRPSGRYAIQETHTDYRKAQKAFHDAEGLIGIDRIQLETYDNCRIRTAKRRASPKRGVDKSGT